MSWLTCLFGHEHLRERLEDGAYVLRCVQCGQEVAVLPNQSFPVKPIKPMKAKRVKKTKKILERTCATAVVATFVGRK